MEFILQCQDADDGGIADRPGNMADVFHTFFGICGLSLMGYFKRLSDVSDVDKERFALFRNIDPTYALPVDIVEALNVPRQVMPNPHVTEESS